MDAWQTFFATQAAAAATLTGLLFVGVSLNLSKILSVVVLPQRAAQALILLAVVLITASLQLIPVQSVAFFGVEVLIIGVILSAIVFSLNSKMLREVSPEIRQPYIRNLFANLPILAGYVVGGIVLATGNEIGLILLALAMLGSFVKVIVDSWVLLVEINR